MSRAFRLSAAIIGLLILDPPSAGAAPAARAGEKQARPSPHAFRKLVDSTRGSVVRLVSPRGTGVLIGVRGELLVPDEGLGDGPLAVEYKGQRLEATVRERDASLGLALVALPPGDYPAANVGAAAALSRGSFVLALALDRAGTLKTAVGTFAGVNQAGDRMRAKVGGPPGFAAFNARGELVGVHVPRRRVIVPIEAVRARFARPRSEG